MANVLNKIEFLHGLVGIRGFILCIIKAVVVGCFFSKSAQEIGGVVLSLDFTTCVSSHGPNPPSVNPF